MSRRTPRLACLALLLTACGKTPAPKASVCPRHFEANEDGHCVGIVPASPCPGGTMTLLGERSCLPIGPLRCPAGTEISAGGWGCEPILPLAPCLGDTRALPGSDTCEPVASCSGQPVLGATHFVDPTFSSTDATHFQTIRAALAAAPEGATIAVASGVYTENLVITRGISLIGTCPGETVLQAPALNQGMGISIRGARGVQIARLTLRGFLPGVGASGGAEASLLQVIIEDSIAYGAIAIDPNTRLLLLHSVIRATQAGAGEVWGVAAAVNQGGRLDVISSTLADNVGVAAYVSGTGVLLLDQSVILRTRLDSGSQNDAGVYVHSGGKATVQDSMIIASSGMGIVATDPGSRLTVTDSIVTDTVSDETGLAGFGLSVLAGATASIEGLSALGNRSLGIVIRGATATLTHTVVRDTLPSDRPWTTLAGHSLRLGTGLWIARGASVEITDSASIGGIGSGVHVDASTATFENLRIASVGIPLEGPGAGADLILLEAAKVAIEGFEVNSLNARALWASDAQTSLTGARWMLNTLRTDSEYALGGIVLTRKASADLDAVWLDRYSVFSAGVINGSTLTLEESVIGGTLQGLDGRFGAGVYCVGDSFLHLRGSEVWGSPHAGVWLEDCGGSLVRSRILDNSVGLRAVEGITVKTVSELPPTVALGVLLIDEETVFEGNATRISTDRAPLPDPPPPSDPVRQ